MGSSSTNGWVNEQDVVKLAYNELTGKLYAIAPRRVFVKANPSTNWQDITPAVIANMDNNLTLSDFECTHNPSGKVVFSTQGTTGSHKLFIYDENSQQWSSRSFTFNPNSVAWGIWNIAINGNDDIYMLVMLNTEQEYKLYKTGVTLNSPLVLRNGNLTGTFGMSSRWVRGLVASQVNPDLVYVVSTSGFSTFISKSTDAGLTFTPSSGGHSDGRAIVLYHGGGSNPNGDDDIIYAGTDGGVAKKEAGPGLSFISLSGNGLTINQFISVSTNPANDGMAVAGAIDNGNFSYMRSRSEQWVSTVSGWDGMVDVFANNGEPRAYTQYQWGMEQQFYYDETNNSVTASDDIAVTPYEFAQTLWQRPLHFDASNTAKYGSHFIWERQITDPVDQWDPVFGNSQNIEEPKPSITTQSTPTNTDLLVDHKRPVEFIISDQDPDVGYIAYFDINWNGDAHLNDLIGNLFVSQTLTTTQSWTNISPPEVTFGPITSIVVDQTHPNRIWVSYGGTDAGQIGTSPSLRTKRVLYSNNYGLYNSWVDVSKGLPALPIIQLLYVPGSDDILFAATDIGVYRWNKAEGEWECFNDGMPRQIITYLDYIPCSGRLRVSTYGRGIWESNVYPDNNYTPGITDEISANTTWSGSKTMTGSIRVKTGATLTISGAGTKIYMPKESRILVEPNAKLIVDGATITNGCDGCRWQGVELTGNRNQPPLPQYQGYIEMKNGAVLEKASMAIRNLPGITAPGAEGSLKPATALSITAGARWS